METKLKQKIIDKLRKIAPLGLRRKIGPIIAYFIYIKNVYIFKNKWVPKVLSIEETVDLIKNEKLSAIRFGDGEMSLIDNTDLGFQKRNNILSEKLKIILQTNKKGLLICIPGIWKKLNVFTKRSFWFTLHHLFRYGHMWENLLSHDQVYGDAFITRPYLTLKDKSNSEKIFRKLKSIWEEKEVILIEGEKSRLGVGNDLFDKTKSLKRILCPSENAFEKYDKILSEALKINKDKLVLISLGPTAKVLAYDLFLSGYRVIDIGHIDMEYEMFLRKETNIIKVKYKYFNEINEKNPESCDDSKYLGQILAHIK